MDKILKRTRKHETSETLDHFKSFLSYDPDSGNLTYKDTRFSNKEIGQVVGYEDAGYLRLWSMSRAWFCHRVAWALYYGEWPSGTIDHINGNPLDNRVSNLRVCSSAENMKNRPAYSGKIFKGVYKTKSGWRSQIVSGGKVYWVGGFKCLGQALKAYDKKAKELHGKYARLNLPTLDRP